MTPMAVDASRPFPFLANKTLNLAVEIINQDEEQSMGLVQVPSVLPRLVEVEGEGKRTFVFWKILSLKIAMIFLTAAKFGCSAV